MDQDSDEGHPRRGRGRPRKAVSHGVPGRPRKTDSGGQVYQSRGLRVPKTKFTAPPTTMATRLTTGSVQPKDYGVALRPRPRPRRALDQDESDNNEEGDEDEVDLDDPFADDGNAEPNNPDDENQDNGDSDNQFPLPDSDDDLYQLDLNPDNFNPHFQTFDEYLENLESDEPQSQGKQPSQESAGVGPSKYRPRRQPLPADSDLEDIDNNLADPDDNMIGYISKQPTASFEDKSELTHRSIRAYFPARKSYFDEDGLRRVYWNEEIEEEFKNLWLPDDLDSRFKQGPRIHSEELQLWKMMFIRYRKIPSHLFTYGLKLGVDCYEAPESLMLSSKASYLLQRICAHQVWGETIESLRYVLQAVARASVELHPKPIGAQPTTVGFEYTSNPELRPATEKHIGTLHYDMWRSNKPDRKREIRRLISQLDGRIRPNKSKEKSKHSLFILTIDMMEDLLQVLDRFDRAIYVLTTEESIKHFRHFYGNFLDQVEPRDNEELVRFKWSLEMCELRDIEIRKVMRMSDENDDFLHDIPHTSTTHSYEVPLYHHHEEVDNKILPVLRGEVIDPKRALLQKLDRMDNNRAQALDEFTTKLAEAVLLDEEPEEVGDPGDPSDPSDPNKVGDPGEPDKVSKLDKIHQPTQEKGKTAEYFPVSISESIIDYFHLSQVPD